MHGVTPLLFLVLSSVSYAESDWKVVSASVDDFIHYVDASSIRMTTGQRRAWVRVKYGYEMTAGTKSN